LDNARLEPTGSRENFSKIQIIGDDDEAMGLREGHDAAIGTIRWSNSCPMCRLITCSD